jgi:hypothetical protein
MIIPFFSTSTFFVQCIPGAKIVDLCRAGDNFIELVRNNPFGLAAIFVVNSTTISIINDGFLFCLPLNASTKLFFFLFLPYTSLCSLLFYIIFSLDFFSLLIFPFLSFCLFVYFFYVLFVYH